MIKEWLVEGTREGEERTLAIKTARSSQSKSSDLQVQRRPKKAQIQRVALGG